MLASATQNPPLSFRCPSLDQDDISIFNNIILPLREHLPRSLDIVLVAVLLQHAEVIHNALNERLLEIPVDHARCLRRLGALADSPLPDLVGSGGEEGAEFQGGAHGGDDFWEGGFCAEGFAFLRSGFVGVEAGEAFFEGDGHGDDGVAGRVFFDPAADGGEVLVLLADVVFFRKVDEVDDGLGGEEE